MARPTQAPDPSDTWIEDGGLNRIAHAIDWTLLRRMSADRMERLADVLAPRAVGVELIRCGEAGDGGYILPDDLDGLAACFSPGVDRIATFETAMIARGLPCFLADASVEAAPISGPLVHFEKLFLGPVTRPGFITLDDWVKRHAPPKGDLILQMDIEGAEYDVLATASVATLSRFRVIVIELHRTHLALRARHYPRIMAALQQLATHFVPVHLHPNNARPFVRFGDYVVPRTLEVTYLRRDRIRSAPAPVAVMPHPLDQTNVPTHPDPPLPDWLWRRA